MTKRRADKARAATIKRRSPRNKTLACSAEEQSALSLEFLHLKRAATAEELVDRVIHQDLTEVLPKLPASFVDLLVIDPPYNLTKNYHGRVFRAREAEDYAAWFEEILVALLPALRPTASVYVCGDWRTSTIVFPILERHLEVRNRITWERDKGRGAKSNWKNNSEDIWFCTVGDDYCFNVEDVKLRKRVMAPYRDTAGEPKDWDESSEGGYRLTHPSNLWTDITVPFWSMPENTEHPTQKPEKLLAKLILASSRPGDLVFDPFLGSGTTAVAAKKLGRDFCGVEWNAEYCAWAAKRLHLADSKPVIQGYAQGVFWERNAAALKVRRAVESRQVNELP